MNHFNKQMVITDIKEIERIKKQTTCTTTYNFFGINISVNTQTHADIDHLNYLFKNFWIKDRKDVDITFYFKSDDSTIPISKVYYEFNGVFYKWIFEDTPLPPLIIPPLSKRFLLIHGCALATDADEGLIFPGASLSGKTTLSIGLMQKGLKSISDDLLIIDPINFDILPFPIPISIREDTIKIIEGFEDIMYNNIYMKYTMDENGKKVWLAHIDDLFPNIRGGKSTIKYIIFPKYVSNSETKLEQISRTSAFLNLLEHGNNSGLIKREYAELVRELIKRVDCYSLNIGDIKDACEAVIKKVNKNT